MKRVAIYLQKSIIRLDWRSAGLETSKIIDTEWKGNNTLIFEVSLLYKLTDNNSV